jgi:low affinity Fe/Cu permease
MNDRFRVLAQKTAELVGSPWSFLGAVLIVVGWTLAGLILGFSEIWLLVIAVVTEIATFLMVFLIQNTQNRDFKALHLKLDELILSVEGTRPHLVKTEELSDEELERLEGEIWRRRHERQGRPATHRSA